MSNTSSRASGATRTAIRFQALHRRGPDAIKTQARGFSEHRMAMSCGRPDGAEFETVELAFEEARASAKDLMAEKIRGGQKVNGHRFEIADADGMIVAASPERFYKSLLPSTINHRKQTERN